MLTTRVIPCLDVRDGRIVKGVRFSGLRDAGSPTERAAIYEAQGADELVMLDVSATPEGRANQVETVRAVRACLSIPLTIGGGVRRIEDAVALLDAGADKVSINTAAVDDPTLLSRMADRFGCQCTILAIDAARHRLETGATRDPLETGAAQHRLETSATVDGNAGGWRVVVRSGSDRTARDVIEWAIEGVRRGAGEILLTSWDRDGTRSGYDTELIRAVRDAVSVPVIASGGANRAEHLLEAIRAGADAVLAASIFHDGDTTVADVKRFLAEHGAEVRL